jgi:tryptophan-rich sensory protein
MFPALRTGSIDRYLVAWHILAFFMRMSAFSVFYTANASNRDAYHLFLPQMSVPATWQMLG